ncbi:uncharacterized protein A1O5_11270 [Cladophialophora psammophila CBS 110553]|uniref:RING-type E3 ubiquitin transferase n=1 Tax=Cladophialophora psammophila CBS 110553 TaxID=1182543 RepID=W9WCB2_9EURO|nr:uncharacterized protein A1O5_11270 [Cladophialophora psammophila CBS 110553]EXJ65742.1 hypothetical protein A1O5_11270 [Cladophialophora psammophila CBS 110553]
MSHGRLNANERNQLEPSETPSTYQFGQEAPPPSSLEPPSSPLSGLHSHNPWSEDANDDDGTNFTTFEFTTTGGAGRMVLSTRSWRSDGRNVRTNDLREMIDKIEQLLTRPGEPQNRGMPGPFGPLSPFGFPRGQGAGGLDDPHIRLQPAGLQDLFSLILQSMQPDGLHGLDADDRRRGGNVPLPFDLVHQMLNPGNARAGDIVHSQEAFDRIMSDLMDLHDLSPNAPPPASEEAILSLNKKKMDREMLGEEGKAECSICMDDVELGNEVTVLPCNHWFHGDCVTAWLKEHDTCPHCRKPITDPEDHQRPGPSRRRTSRRASSVLSPRALGADGGRPNLAERTREMREISDYLSRRQRDNDLERPETHRHSSIQSDLRRHGSRGQSGSNGGNRSGGNSGGGVTGWIRDHLPFS